MKSPVSSFGRLATVVLASVLAISIVNAPITPQEPALLVAGISHWKGFGFRLYRVNPPFVRMVAALPVIWTADMPHWEFGDDPEGRPEFSIGSNFIRRNADRSYWLMTLARFACLPFSLFGALCAQAYARELWRSEWAGFLAVILWTIEPNILAHSQLITNDVACSAFGLACTWLFWRWLKRSTWKRAGLAGVMFGLAQLTKMSWLVLFGLWPLLWGVWIWRSQTQSRMDKNKDTAERVDLAWRMQLCQLMSILVLGVYLINLGYGFDGTCTRLKSFDFISSMLTGNEKVGEVGNRFRGTLLGEVPIPFPKQYVLGFDMQKRDFEYWNKPSYLRGEWKRGGWWYYYLYGLCVKVPHGMQLLFLLAVLAPLWEGKQFTRSSGRPQSGECSIFTGSPTWPDILVLLAPGLSLFLLVSAQLEFNEHFRYVLPSIAVLLVFSSRLGRLFESTLHAPSG